MLEQENKQEPVSQGSMPAYPFKLLNGVKPWATGINKREYFAGLAMQGLCANATVYEQNRGVNKDVIILNIAQLSVKYADELLKALGD